MENDYQKLSYMKILELERRLNLIGLEKQILDSKSLHYNDFTRSAENIANLQFDFNGNHLGFINMTADLSVDSSGEKEYFIYFNNDLIMEGSFSGSTQLNFDCYSSHLNCFTVKVVGTNDFNLMASLTVEGNVEDNKNMDDISVVNFSDCSYYAMVKKGNARVYKYKNSITNEVLELTGVREIALAKLSDETLIIAIVKDSGSLELKHMTIDTNNVFVTYNIYQPIKSINIMVNQGQISVYGIIKGWVSVIAIDDNFLYSTTKLSLHGSGVNVLIEGERIYLILKKATGDQILYISNLDEIGQYLKIYKLAKSCTHKLHLEGDNIMLYKAVDKKVYRQQLENNLLQESEFIGYGDEFINLINQKKLIRTDNQIKII